MEHVQLISTGEVMKKSKYQLLRIDNFNQAYVPAEQWAVVTVRVNPMWEIHPEEYEKWETDRLLVIFDEKSKAQSELKKYRKKEKENGKV